MKSLVTVLATSVCMIAATTCAAEDAAPAGEPVAPAERIAEDAPREEPEAPESGVPVILSVSPRWCELGKAADVVINGKFFAAGRGEFVSRLFLDRREIAKAKVISSSEIRVTVPPRRRPGWARIEIRNPDSQSCSIDEGFHYGPIPKGWWGALAARFGSFLDRFMLGGPLMFVILALSITGLAWFIHCLAYMRPLKLLPANLKARVATLASQGDFAEARKACERNNSLLSRVALAGIKEAGEPPDKVAEAIGSAGSRESAHLFQKISYLSNIGVVSPMLGLFGTVLGMILVFDSMTQQEQAHLILMGAGVSKALYTTAFGLIVGIPAMCAYYYLRGKVVRLVTLLEEDSEELAKSMTEGANRANRTQPRAGRKAHSLPEREPSPAENDVSEPDDASPAPESEAPVPQEGAR